MKCFIISFLLVLGAQAHGFALTTYILKWDVKDLPVELHSYEGNASLSNRIAETGEVKDLAQLSIIKELKDGHIDVPPGADKVIILTVKNTSQKKIKFAVAPHMVTPPPASLGMSFKCLCNGHKYSVAPGATWYRIMQLRTFKQVDASTEPVTLEHQLFSVK